MMDRRRALMMDGGATPRLPSAYQEVEWIGGNGMPDPTMFPYISPGIKAQNGDFFKAHFKPIQITTECVVIGQNLSPQMELYYTSPTKINVYLMKSETLTVGNPYDVVTVYGDSRTNNTYKIGYWSNTAKYVSEYRLFYFLHRRNGVDLLELIPCYRKSDNVIGMYDLVSGTFFTNAGTGTFTKGGNV